MAVPIVAIIETGEDAQQSVVNLVSDLSARVHAEPGCERYDAFTSGRAWVVLLEQWQDGASLRAHSEGPAFSELMSGLAALSVPAPTVHVLRPVDTGR